MKKYIILVVYLIYFFAEFKADEIAKDILEKKGSKVSERNIKVKNLDIQFIKQRVVLNNLSVKSVNQFPGNFVTIRRIELTVDAQSFFKKRIEVKNIHLDGIKVYYQAIKDKNEVIDNLVIAEPKSKTKTKKVKNTNKKETEKKKFDKDFVIKNLMITNATVRSDYLKKKRKNELTDMEFFNVSNLKGSNHYNAVISKIAANAVFNVTDNFFMNIIKKGFESKMRNMLNKEL